MFFGLFPESFRKKAGKTTEIDRKKAETFSGKKRNLLSFKVYNAIEIIGAEFNQENKKVEGERLRRGEGWRENNWTGVVLRRAEKCHIINIPSLG